MVDGLVVDGMRPSGVSNPFGPFVLAPAVSATTPVIPGLTRDLDAPVQPVAIMGATRHAMATMGDGADLNMGRPSGVSNPFGSFGNKPGLCVGGDALGAPPVEPRYGSHSTMPIDGLVLNMGRPSGVSNPFGPFVLALAGKRSGWLNPVGRDALGAPLPGLAMTQTYGNDAKRPDGARCPAKAAQYKNQTFILDRVGSIMT